MTQIAFYRLSRKVVNNEQAIPEDARQVLYYSLAIGHHVGVMDCFSELMSVSQEQYSECIERLPDGEARRKLEGAAKWQEIEINRGHVDPLLPALNSLLPTLSEPDRQWVEKLIACLREMVAEPAFYMMVKARQWRGESWGTLSSELPRMENTKTRQTCVHAKARAASGWSSPSATR